MHEPIRSPLVIGAGPAGLTAALTLTKSGVTPRLFEASGHVGGLARTPSDGDWRVDPGGHRFFTRSEEVLDLWKSLLPPDQWLSVRRSSAMLVDGRYVRYPLVGGDLLRQMGIGRGIYGSTSLAWARLRRGMRLVDDVSFREWGTYEFGRYWYHLFFDGYVRKTWHTDPGDITSDWANQRIRPIRWRSPEASKSADHDTFRYPRLGPGQLWDAAAAVLADAGVVPSLNTRVVRTRFDGDNWTVELDNGDTATGDAVFSSMPLRLLVDTLEPAPPEHIRAAAAALKHRSLITIGVALRGNYDIPHNWVYTPGKNLQAGRIQNYGRWSRDLAPQHWEGTYLGLEYFIGPDRDLWTASDERLTRIAEQDLRQLGVVDSAIERVMPVRSEFAYPVYDSVRERSVARVGDHLRRHYPSLHPIGRNGMHHYDNQDHAMLSAMHSVARYFGKDTDPWQVNTDRRYQESGLLKR